MDMELHEKQNSADSAFSSVLLVDQISTRETFSYTIDQFVPAGTTEIVTDIFGFENSEVQRMLSFLRKYDKLKLTRLAIECQSSEVVTNSSYDLVYCDGEKSLVYHHELGLGVQQEVNLRRLGLSFFDKLPPFKMFASLDCVRGVILRFSVLIRIKFQGKIESRYCFNTAAGIQERNLKCGCGMQCACAWWHVPNRSWANPPHFKKLQEVVGPGVVGMPCSVELEENG
jgi:hypothetical protein